MIVHLREEDEQRKRSYKLFYDMCLYLRYQAKKKRLMYAEKYNEFLLPCKIRKEDREKLEKSKIYIENFTIFFKTPKHVICIMIQKIRPFLPKRKTICDR